MRKIFILLFLFIINIYGQEILKPNKNYNFPDTMIVFTGKEFNKLDSLMHVLPVLKQENKLLSDKISVMDNIDKKQKEQISLLIKQDTLNKLKLDLAKEREDLIKQKVEVYKDLYTDVEKELGKKNKKTKFSNNTFWFGTGAVVGVVTIFISSVIFSNINNNP